VEDRRIDGQDSEAPATENNAGAEQPAKGRRDAVAKLAYASPVMMGLLFSKRAAAFSPPPPPPA